MLSKYKDKILSSEWLTNIIIIKKYNENDQLILILINIIII